MTGKRLAIAAAVLVGLAVLATLALVAKNAVSRGGDLTVGDCITNSSYVAADMDLETVGCENTSGVFELAAKTTNDGSCPDGLRDTSTYAVLMSRTMTLCFVLNLDAGECYTIEASTRSSEPSACASGAGVVRVEQRIDGSADESVCAPGQTSISYPEPARVYCLSAV